MAVDAVILAGADNDGKLKDYDKASYEALIDINGKPMVEYVVRAVRGASSIRNVVVVGPAEALARCLHVENVKIMDRGSSILENLKIGVVALSSLGPDDKVLIVTADIPLLTSEVVDQFLASCAKRQAEFHYPILSREANDSRFPGMKRTYATLRDGTFTGGNVMLVNPGAIGSCEALVKRVIDARKNPWQWSRMLGLKYTVKFMFRTLTIRDVEARVERMVGMTCVAVFFNYPEVGLDVDKPSDLALVRRVLCPT